MLKAFAKRLKPSIQIPQLISYEALSAFKDEPRFELTRAEYQAIQQAITDYVRAGHSLVSGKISRKTHPIKYSVNIAQGQFILSHHIARINELESYMYRAPGDTRPLKVQKNKKPMLYDAAINLNTGKALFIKEYRDTSINAAQSAEKRIKQIQKLKAEHENWTALKKPCLFWSRGNKHYLATPYIEKNDFYEWMDKDCGTLEDTVEIYKSIVRQTVALHKKGWLHCDIKAENFIPTKSDQGIHAEFIDGATFHPISKASQISEIISSNNIVNPQWERDFKIGKAKYGVQTDIYALNILLRDVANYIDSLTKLDYCYTVSKELASIQHRSVIECLDADSLLERANNLSQALQTLKVKGTGASFACM